MVINNEYDDHILN